MDEGIIIDGPERGVELSQLLLTKQVLGLFLIHNQALFGKVFLTH